MNLVSSSRGAVVTFAVALSTLASQILFHRVISAKLLNNYAFLVISLTMLGFACSGVILSRKLSGWLERLDDMIPLWTALWVLSSLLVTILFYWSPIGSQEIGNRSEYVQSLLRTIPYALLFAVPFLFSGLLLGGILSNPAFSSRLMYGSDLIGSACGALLVIPMISTGGVEKAILWIGLFLIVIVMLVVPPASFRVRCAVALAASALIWSLYFERQIFVFRYPEGTMLARSYVEPEDFVIEHTAWDPVARIEVSRIPPFTPEGFGFPSLVGGNLEFLSRFKRLITQNNFAFTMAVEYDGNPISLNGIQETIYAGAYLPQTVLNPKVAVIGVGGGFDILTGLAFNAKEIIGIEINAAMLRILKEDYAQYFKPWVHDARVRLVHDDGRNYLAESAERFDIIQLSGVDTYSGSPGAAHVFSENYLYTLEAFRLYYSRLSEAGVFNVMRLEHRYPREMLRVLATAMTALRLDGIEHPDRHIAVLGARDGTFVALLVKKSPFTRQEIDRVVAWGDANKYTHLLAAPFFEPPQPNVYSQVLAINNADEEKAFFESGWSFVLSPSTDNWPFFFQFSRWSHLFSDDEREKRIVPVMQITLSMLFVVTALIAVVCVWWPIRRFQKSQGIRGSWRYGIIFSGTAFGYLAIEMALLQRFGLFLGHPNYALSVVLAGLLFSSGVGAFLSYKLTAWMHGPRVVAYLLSAIVLLECILVFPGLYGWHIEGFVLRVVTVLLLIAPIGILIGTFVPLAFDGMKRTTPHLVPWAWGVNGIFSVMAPIVSVAFSITWGIDALLLASIPIYMVVSWCFPNQNGRWLQTRQFT